MNKYDLGRQISGNISSILMYGTIALTPLFGWIADYKGKSATLMYLGSALLIIAHLMFAKTMITPYIPIFILGVAFSLVPAAMWPAVTKIVGENKIGTAYGAMFSVQNLGLWALPILIGVVLDASNPNYEKEINNAQFATLQDKKVYEDVYKIKGDDVVKNESFKVKYIIHADSCKGDIMWKSYNRVKSDDEGKYNFKISDYEILAIAEYDLIDIKKYDLGIRLEKIESGLFKDEDTTTIINKDTFALASAGEAYTNVYKEEGKIVKDKSVDMLVTLFDWKTNDLVYQEKQSVRIDEKGKMHVELGDGVVQNANYNYINFEDNEYCAEVLEPLDYTNPMLMLSLLGVLGIFFAFLLKRDDKVSGYGLEQPNKTE
jgi:hypothetical protein